MPSFGRDQWRLCVFDAFRLEKNGEVVTFFQNRRQDEVLAMLALDASRPQRRHDIALALWPEKAEKLRYNRLTEVLVHCRRLLDEVGLPDDAILRGRGVIQLNPAVQTDISEFNRLVRAAKSTEDPVALQQVGTELRSMYGNGPLPLFSAPSIDEPREELSKTFSGVMERTEVLVGAGPDSWSPGPIGTLVRPATGAPGIREIVTPEPAPAEPEEAASPEIIEFVREAAAYLWSAERSDWVARIEERYHEILEFVEGSLDRGETEAAAEMLGELWQVWLQRPGEDRGRVLVERTLLELPISDNALSGRLLHGAGVLALRTGENTAAKNRLERARAIWERQNNRLWYARATNSLGILLFRLSQFEEAAALQHESVYLLRSLNQPEFLMQVLYSAAQTETALERFARAKPLFIESIALARSLNNNAMVGRNLLELSSLYMRQEDWAMARKAVDEGLAAYENVDDPFPRASGLRVAAFLMHQEGNLKEAAAQFEVCEQLFREAGDLNEVGRTLVYLAGVYSDLGRREDAIAKCASGLELAKAAGDLGLVAAAKEALADLLSASV